jgi:hypothetical protein
MADATDGRLDCLILGTSIGDQITDLSWALQEMGELPPGSRQSDATFAVANETISRLDDDVSRAKIMCGLPVGVEELVSDIRKARASGDLSRGDLGRLRSATAALSDKLGQLAAGDAYLKAVAGRDDVTYRVRYRTSGHRSEENTGVKQVILYNRLLYITTHGGSITSVDPES